MKVLTLLGSARKKGNTATVLGWIEEEMQALGHQVDRVNLASKSIKGCLGCEKCKTVQDKPGCVQKDDGLPTIEQMVDSDAVIFASPLYYWGFSAHMKALIDRCYSLYRGSFQTPSHFSFVEDQRQALVVTAADPYENNAEFIVASFQRMLGYSKAKSSGELVVCNCTSPDDLGEEIKEKAVEFARRLFEGTGKPYPVVMQGNR